jgi:LuxR family maltose regulon positive regulatory protein
MLEIRLDDLRFTLEEAAGFLNGCAEFNLGKAEIEIIAGRTEGWIAGIQMAGLSLRGKENKAQFIQSWGGSHRYILDYLAEEVLNSQSEPVQQFLLSTCILDRLSAPLCEAMAIADFSTHPAQEMLEYLERANLFLIALDEERRWYRYHHLFADLLRVRLKVAARANPNLIPHLHRRAAVWLEAQGWLSEAIQHFIDAGEYEKAVSLVEEQTHHLFAQGELHPLLRWIQLLPAELAARRPRLRVYQAWTLVFAGKPQEVAPLLQQVEQVLAAGDFSAEEAHRLRGEMIAIRGMADLTSGNIPAALALQNLPPDAIPPESLFARSVERWVLGYVWRLQGDLALAMRAFEETLQLGRQLNNVWTIISASVDLGEVLRQSGRLRAAENVYREALQVVYQSASPNPGFLGRIEAFLAVCLLEQNKIEEADALILSAIEHNRRWENPNHITYAYLVYARAARTRGDYAAAWHALDLANQIVAQAVVIPNLKNAAELQSVRLGLAEGQMAQANRWFADHLQQAGDLPLRMSEEVSNNTFMLVRVMLAKGDRQPTLRLLNSLEADARAGGKTHNLIETLILKSLAEIDPQKASATLLEAVTLGVPEGYRRIYLDEGEPFRKLLIAVRTQIAQKTAVPRNGELELLDTLLTAFGNSPNTAETHSAPLTEREIEILRCIAEGLTNAQIGKRLYISAGTVKAHSAAIYRKLDVANRSEAISLAKDLGLI